MAKILRPADFYRELVKDPDLRRLGDYKVVADKGQAILEIDVKLDDKEIHLGKGDFKDAFVAFAETTCISLDFGRSKFTDLYLDKLEAGSVSFSRSRASRLYFDSAKIGVCHFADFRAPEVYFDDATIKTVNSERLLAGNIYIEGSNRPNLYSESLRPNAYRITFGKDRTTMDGLPEGGVGEKSREEDVAVFTTEEFLRHLREGVDLSRLGKYRIVPKEGTDSLIINVDLEGRDIKLGSGDFTSVNVLFGATTARVIDFSDSRFRDLNLQFAKVENCFFSDFEGKRVDFGEAEIKNIFWERGRATEVYLDRLRCNQFNLNSMETDELRLGGSEIREMYLSRWAGIRRLFCERARLQLLNLHEGRLKEVQFGISSIEKAFLNKATSRVVNAEGLRSRLLYFGNDGKNTIGELQVGENKEIQHIELGKILPPRHEGGRQALEKISLGPRESVSRGIEG